MSDSQTHAIIAEGLVKTFGTTRALAGVDLEVRTGAVVGMLGPNGAGKTTAVRVLATLLEPTAGRARVGGYDVVREAHQVRQLIGLTGQFASVDENLTGFENLLFIGRLLGIPKEDAKARSSELLDDFGLTDAAHRATKTYSGGMRRRLDLAASLVGRPRILFLDEPTTGLDPRARADVWQMIRQLTSGGATVLLTTQYLEEADQLADEIIVIDQGKVIATGTPEDLKAKTGSQALILRPARPDQVPIVVSIVSGLTAAEAEISGDVVTVPIADPAVMPRVVRQLEDAGVLLTELSLRGSTLDEVFLALTGHTAEPEAGTEGESA